MFLNELHGLPFGTRSIQRRMLALRNEDDLGFHASQLVVQYQDLANAGRYALVFVLSDGASAAARALSSYAFSRSKSLFTFEGGFLLGV